MQPTQLRYPVTWFEGMPLLPHHFQQQFAYTQSHLQTCAQAFGPFQYGLLGIDYDLLSLTNNVFKLNNIHAFFQDGTAIQSTSLEQNDKLEYVLPVPSSFENSSLSIYISLPKQSDSNFLNGKFPRYLSECQREVYDHVSGQEPIEMLRMIPNVILMSDLDFNHNFLGLKVAQLRVDKNLWVFDDYVPACFFIDCTNPIYKLCSEICFSVRKKIQHISDQLSAKASKSNSHFISESLFYAQALGVGLPAIECLLTTEKSHPFQIYIALCQLLGGCGLLTENFTPPVPAKYLHEDLLKCFLKIEKDINSIINAVIDDKIKQILFQKDNHAFYLDNIEKYIKNNAVIIGFKKRNSIPESDFLHWIKSAVMCERNEFEITIQNRTNGLERVRFEKQDEILPTRGMYLFEIKNIKKNLKDIFISNANDLDIQPDDVYLVMKKD